MVDKKKREMWAASFCFDSIDIENEPPSPSKGVSEWAPSIGEWVTTQEKDHVYVCI